MGKNLPRVVIDTNIFYSALLFGGNPSKIILIASKNRIISIISLPILNEIEILFETKASFSRETIQLIVSKIKEYSTVVLPKNKLNIVRHDADNKIIEAAVEGDCQYVITGDKDLLVLKNYKKIKILTPSEFLKIFENK